MRLILRLELEKSKTVRKWITDYIRSMDPILSDLIFVFVLSRGFHSSHGKAVTIGLVLVI